MNKIYCIRVSNLPESPWLYFDSQEAAEHFLGLIESVRVEDAVIEWETASHQVYSLDKAQEVFEQWLSA